MSTTFGPESAYLAALDSVVSRIEKVELRIREAEAERLRLLAEALDIAACESENRVSSMPSGEHGELAYRCVRSEVATALHLSERTVERQMSQAFTLVSDYSATFDAYRSGSISERHAAVITEAGAVIGTGDAPEVIARRAAYETAVLEVAVSENPARLRPIARRLAEQCSEASLDERHAEARKQRRVYIVDSEDGMSDLVAHLPAVEAHGIYRRLTDMGRKLSQHEIVLQREAAAVPGNEDVRRVSPRGRDELRADLLSDILLSGSPESIANGGPVGLGAIRAHVQVTLHARDLRLPQTGFAGAPWESDAGHPVKSSREHATDDLVHHSNAVLLGFGPIDNDTAGIIAGHASHWETVREDVSNGRVLSVARYRPSEAMRRHLGARDQHCRFPGCRVPLARCDIDHTIDAAKGGPTATDNLAHLCRGHHTLKHGTGWHVDQGRSGELRWRSPTGRTYEDTPPSSVRFRAATADLSDVPDSGSYVDASSRTASDPPPF